MRRWHAGILIGLLSAGPAWAQGPGVPLRTTAPAANDPGVVTRNLPSGTQTTTDAGIGPWDNVLPSSGRGTGASDGTDLRPIRGYDLDETATAEWALGVVASSRTGVAGTLDGANDTAIVDVRGQIGAGVQIASGTLEATIVPELSLDGGTTWVASYFADPATGRVHTNLVLTNPSSATARAILLIGGATHARVRVSSFTSGSASATLRTSQAVSPDATQGVDGQAIPPAAVIIGGSDGTNTRAAQLRNAAPGGSDYGVVVRAAGNINAVNATAANLKVEAVGPAADGAAVSGNPVRIAGKDGSGNTQDIATDTSGELQVDVLTLPALPAGSNNIGDVDIASAPTGASSIQVQGTAADGAAVAGNPIRIGGKDGSGNTQDIATDTAGELQVDVLTLPSVTIGTFPDNEPFNVAQFGGSAIVTGTGASGAGIPRVTLSNDSSLAANQSVNVNQIGGSAVSTVTTGVQKVAVADAGGNAIDGTTTRPLDAARGLVVRQPMACTAFVAISQTADTQLVTGTAGQRIYICALTIIANAAETVNLISGTGTVCATSPTAIYGSTTEANGMSLAANGGFANVAAQPFVRTSVDGDNLCLTQVGTSRVTGMLSYMVAPND
jgi:hypothetical protein